jgi:hypothetical protein
MFVLELEDITKPFCVSQLVTRLAISSFSSDVVNWRCTLYVPGWYDTQPTMINALMATETKKLLFIESISVK